MSQEKDVEVIDNQKMRNKNQRDRARSEKEKGI